MKEIIGKNQEVKEIKKEEMKKEGSAQKEECIQIDMDMVISESKKMRYLSFGNELKHIKKAVLLQRIRNSGERGNFTILGCCFQIFFSYVLPMLIYAFSYTIIGCLPYGEKKNWSFTYIIESISLEYSFRWVHSVFTPILVYLSVFDEGLFYTLYMCVLSQMYVFLGAILYGLVNKNTQKLTSCFGLFCCGLSLLSTFFVQKNFIKKSSNYGAKKSTQYLFLVLSMQTLLTYGTTMLAPRIFIFLR
ncbi:hypothetical protein NEFER03_0848 [Nematocida sp. LUAm3]|nr:hypothetical protein NEFER03_0848 [Nematocida sp. LUAm3]KAI5174866.1 hypothetical protein NEFER02_0966 [Nematocida sp. LUAm2]KAI5177536.1 hypothetical protein NEFER01_0786 [Nematocida sp. LUAm1]